MVIKHIHIGIACIMLFFNNIYSQSDDMLCRSDMLPIRESDSVGKYDVSCIVMGIVELDSLVGITYWYKAPFPENNRHFKLRLKKVQYSTGVFYTRMSNVPLNRSMKGENIKLLVQNKDFFLMENRCGVILEYIYPRCDDEEKSRLEYMLSNCTMIYDVAYMPSLDSSWKDVINSKNIKGKECIEEAFFYDAYCGRNEYLLVIMNRKWHDLLVNTETEPPQIFDDTDLYVKYLIPLKPENKKFSAPR